MSLVAQGASGGYASALQEATPVLLAYGQQELDIVVGEVLPSASGRYVLLNGWRDEVGDACCSRSPVHSPQALLLSLCRQVMPCMLVVPTGHG